MRDTIYPYVYMEEVYTIRIESDVLVREYGEQWYDKGFIFKIYKENKKLFQRCLISGRATYSFLTSENISVENAINDLINQYLESELGKSYKTNIDAKNSSMFENEISELKIKNKNQK